jgi:hypothetical protein
VGASLYNYARIVEVEAWTVDGGGTPSNVAPSVSLTSPVNGATLVAPATVALVASASDPDGTIARVDFYRDGTLVGSSTSTPYSHADTGLVEGAYRYTAMAYDNAGASATSAEAVVTVTGSVSARTNVALSSNGGVASASSTYSGSYPASAAINGDRKGVNWGSGGGWNDGSYGAYPDWLQVNFSGVKEIGEIDVFTVQDNYGAPVEPTETLGFTGYGITSYQVQYWNGTAWLDVPGGSVVGNSLVWRKFVFSPVTTDRIRVLVGASLYNYARIVEVEAWTP